MKVALIITTYNSSSYIHQLLNSLLLQEKELFAIFADDGSTDDTVEKLYAFQRVYPSTKVLALPHQERGVARAEALKVAYKLQLDYLMFVDADMVLEDGLIRECVSSLEQRKTVGALVVNEIPVSAHHNLMTKVKLFERKIVNNSNEELDPNSIEAARFWKMAAFKESGGINPKQVAFEETQPTIRYIEMGGQIFKHMGKGLYHDEKKVTVKNILGKKKYHFQMMNTTFETEQNGLLKAFKRWYFFRPVMYKKDNVKEYFKHPILTLGMIGMYVALTAIGCMEILKHRVVNQ